MLIAPVLLVGAVLNSRPPVTVLPAAAQLGVEGVQGLDVESGQGLRPEQRPNVLADAVPLSRLIIGSTSSTSSQLGRRRTTVERVRGLRRLST